MFWKIFETLRKSNTIEYLIHGTNLVFIQENKYIKLTCSNSILKKKSIFNSVTIFKKIPVSVADFTHATLTHYYKLPRKTAAKQYEVAKETEKIPSCYRHFKEFFFCQVAV